MKRLLLLLAVCLPVCATQIVGPILTPFTNMRWRGNVLIQCPGGTDLTGATIASFSQTVTVFNGAFSVSINSGLNKRICSATYTPADATAPWKRTWSIPASTAPLTVNQVEQGDVPPPPMQVHTNQIAPDGATNGQALVWNTPAGQWKPQAVASGGGGIDPHATWAQIKAGSAGSGSVTYTMTWAQIKALP